MNLTFKDAMEFAVKEMQSTEDDYPQAIKMLNERYTALNREASKEFHVGQIVKFQDTKGRNVAGEISNINRDGKIKVTGELLRKYGWSSYSLGAQSLSRYMNMKTTQDA